MTEERAAFLRYTLLIEICIGLMHEEFTQLDIGDLYYKCDLMNLSLRRCLFWSAKYNSHRHD